MLDASEFTMELLSSGSICRPSFFFCFEVAEVYGFSFRYDFRHPTRLGSISAKTTEVFVHVVCCRRRQSQVAPSVIERVSVDVVNKHAITMGQAEKESMQANRFWVTQPPSMRGGLHVAFSWSRPSDAPRVFHYRRNIFVIDENLFAGNNQNGHLCRFRRITSADSEIFSEGRYLRVAWIRNLSLCKLGQPRIVEAGLFAHRRPRSLAAFEVIFDNLNSVHNRKIAKLCYVVKQNFVWIRG